LIPGAFAIALVSFADTSVLSRTFAIRGNYKVNNDQEMVALGITQIAAGLFQGFSISSSSSRTPVAESAGAKTQVTGIVGALCVSLLLLFAPNLVAPLPFAVLGAVAISACFSLVEVREVIRLWKLRRVEFISALLCFLGVALVGVIDGIFIAVALSLGALVWRVWRPYSAVLGRVDNMKGYHDITRHPHAKRVPGLVLFRWDAQLFFANASTFRDKVLAAVESSPTKARWLVVAAEPVTDIDITAADMLMELDKTLDKLGVDLCFAEMKDPVKDHLKRYGIFEHLGEKNFFPTIGLSVDMYIEVNRIDWVDWNDPKP
jgi:MFS superfamily sulfate permease-like transporter